MKARYVALVTLFALMVAGPVYAEPIEILVYGTFDYAEYWTESLGPSDTIDISGKSYVLRIVADTTDPDTPPGTVSRYYGYFLGSGDGYMATIEIESIPGVQTFDTPFYYIEDHQWYQGATRAAIWSHNGAGGSVKSLEPGTAEDGLFGDPNVIEPYPPVVADHSQSVFQASWHGLNGGTSELWARSFSDSPPDMAIEARLLAQPCPCESLSATDFGKPMGKSKKLRSRLPVKFRLYFDDVEVTSQEQLDAVLEESGCEAAGPSILVWDITDPGAELLVEGIEENVGDVEDGTCFRFADSQWIYNLRLSDVFTKGNTYRVEVLIGDCLLIPGNNEFGVK